MRWTPRVHVVAAGLATAALILPGATAGASPTPHAVIGPDDWPTFGASQAHDFVGRTSLTQASVHALAPAWFFPTGDAETAQPIEVAGTVYVGSWDGHFYAIDAVTGKQVWSFTLKPQPAVQPNPGDTLAQRAMQLTSDGGMITSTALFVSGRGSRPDLVVFGGGYTLYALNAATGAPYWNGPTGPGIDYTGLPEQPPQPSVDGTRIFSSPSLVHVPAITGSNPRPPVDEIVFGGSTDGENGFRGYLAAADVETGQQLWRTNTSGYDAGGKPLNNGCGGIWGSPTVIPDLQLEVVGVSDCNSAATLPYSDREIAVSTVDGHVVWVFTPPRLAAGDQVCDFDIGASANLGSATDGTTSFLGVGSKDGYYYRLDPATGKLIWATNVVFGGTAGGFLGTTAYDGHLIVGATGIGDFPPPPCDPTNPADQGVQDPSIHAFDPVHGSVQWQGHGANSFAATTIAGGMVFSTAFLLQQIQIRDEATGLPLAAYPLPSSPASGITVAGNAVFFGTGGPEQGSPDGVYAFTPLGGPVVIPAGPAPPGSG